MRARFAIPAALAAAAFFLAAPAPAQAEKEPGIRMTVEAGVGRTMRGGVWTPVVVELENPGPSVDGFVVVRFSEEGGQKGAAREPVELATGARKRVSVHARPRTGSQVLQVSFEDARERVRAGPEDVSIQTVDKDDVVVGLVSMGGRGDPGMRPLTTPSTRVAVLDAEELPDAWPALDVFDALVIRDPDTAKLGPGRIAAIKVWVAAGGVLIVTAGEKWRTMDDATFTEMLPVRVEGVRTLEARELPPPFGHHEGPLAVAIASPLRGQTLLTGADGEPLVAEARYGAGRVAFLAADPGDLTSVDATFKATLWVQLLRLPKQLTVDPTTPYSYYGGYNTPSQFIQQELSRIPPLQPPSVLLVTLLIGMYVLVVGPGDYFLLKKIGKLHWTWITYPAAIAGFSAMIYGYARFTRSSDMMVRTIALVDAPAQPPGAPAPVRVFGGVYSPRAGRYRIDLRAPVAGAAGAFSGIDPYGGVSAKGEYLARGGSKPGIELSIPIWSMSGVEFASASDEPAPFLVEPQPDGSVRVTNRGSARLEYVGLLVDGHVIDGGPLEPGASVTLSRRDSGRRVADLPTEMSGAMWGPEKNKQDVGRIVRLFAYATDPPRADHSDPYGAGYGARQDRRRDALERPRADRDSPMVFAAAKTAPLIAVHGESVAGDGLTVWRRPVLRNE